MHRLEHQCPKGMLTQLPTDLIKRSSWGPGWGWVMELRHKGKHRMGLFCKLLSDPFTSPRMCLIPLWNEPSRRSEQRTFSLLLSITIYSLFSVQPEILLSTEPGKLPPYITGLKQYRFSTGFTASLVKLQYSFVYTNVILYSKQKQTVHLTLLFHMLVFPGEKCKQGSTFQTPDPFLLTACVFLGKPEIL